MIEKKLGSCVMSSKSPYSDLPEAAFWRSAVADVGVFGMSNLWRSPWVLPSDARFCTYGSCFAQHLSQALCARDIDWLNAEPAPDGMTDKTARKFGYGVFSARTGNIYTSRQLLHWVRLACGQEPIEVQEIWEAVEDNQGLRYRPALAPAIEPDGYASEDEARAALAGSVQAFSRSISDTDVFIFTLGLTEGWVNAVNGAPYALCPGTLAGEFDAETHLFKNESYPGIRNRLETAFEHMRAMNPDLHILLTVSPVPLTATASGDHVLSATTYSKSTLRAVAGDLAHAYNDIDYFPSYEVISGPPTRGAFFAPNLRSVEQAGVSVVMTHFFAGLDMSGPARGKRRHPVDTEGVAASLAEEDLICEEEALGR